MGLEVMSVSCSLKSASTKITNTYVNLRSLGQPRSKLFASDKLYACRRTVLPQFFFPKNRLTLYYEYLGIINPRKCYECLGIIHRVIFIFAFSGIVHQHS